MVARHALLFTFVMILVCNNADAGGKVPLMNGPSIFSDSIGASWTGNNLTLTINPGVVNYPDAQVGEDFPGRTIGKDQVDASGNRLLPPNLAGISFTLDFDSSLCPNSHDARYNWYFSVAAWKGSKFLGLIIIGLGFAEPSGILQSGFEYADGILHLEPVRHPSRKIQLSFDYDFFSTADRYAFSFITGGPVVAASLGFLDIRWLTKNNKR